MDTNAGRNIVAIDAIPLRIPFSAGGRPDAGPWGARGMKAVDALIVKVTTEQGLTGWGESFGLTAVPAVKAAIDHLVAPLCIGQDAALIGQLMHRLQVAFHLFGRSGPIMFGLSALDIALWDIAGKAAGQPVHQLLGGAGAGSLPCYASLIRYSDPELVRQNVRRALDEGYRHIKLHEVRVDCVRAAREEAGDEVNIALDVNCPWDVREALDMADRLRCYKLHWLEEPVWPPEDYDGLARVRKEGGIPVAAGENASTLMEFQHLLQAQAVDFVQPSPAKMGGITELRKVFALASAHHATVMVHTFYDGPGLLASVHASAALGNRHALVEWRYFDLEAQLYGAAGIPVQGALAIPPGPGLGLEPDADVIRDYRVAI